MAMVLALLPAPAPPVLTPADADLADEDDDAGTALAPFGVLKASPVVDVAAPTAVALVPPKLKEKPSVPRAGALLLAAGATLSRLNLNPLVEVAAGTGAGADAPPRLKQKPPFGVELEAVTGTAALPPLKLNWKDGRSWD